LGRLAPEAVPPSCERRLPSNAGASDRGARIGQRPAEGIVIATRRCFAGKEPLMATNPRRSATRAKRITCRRIIRLRADPSRPLLEIPLGERCSRQKKAIRDHERSAGARLRRFEAPQRIGGRPCDGTALLNWKRPGGTASPTCPQLPRVSIDGYSALVVPLPSDPAAIRYRIYKPGFREVAPNCGSACRRANE
jgi:hypothetical protein